MSNTHLEFVAFMKEVRKAKDVNPAIVLVDGTRAGAMPATGLTRRGKRRAAEHHRGRNWIIGSARRI